jgi:hypothetical protein
MGPNLWFKTYFSTSNPSFVNGQHAIHLHCPLIDFRQAAQNQIISTKKQNNKPIPNCVNVFAYEEGRNIGEDEH